MNPTKILVCFVTAALVLAGCTTGPEGQGRLTVYMTDSPASFDAVNIVVERVDVHVSGGDWVTVDETERTYDILTLRNGVTTVMGDAWLTAGHYTQIRLILGTGSTVVVDGVTYALEVPDKEVKLNHQFTIEAGIPYELLLDFEAARSIKETNGTAYKLVPVIRVNAVAQTGSIAGVVVPGQAGALITANSGVTTAVTYADENGAFKLMGLPPGSYSLTVQATQGSFQEATVGGVMVVVGQTTNSGTIALQ